MSTGYMWHEPFGWADSGSGGLFPADPAAGLQPIGHHLAHADTKRRLHQLVAVSGLIDHLERVEARHATEVTPSSGPWPGSRCWTTHCMTGHDLAPHQKALVDEVAALVLPA
ncbi:hypothetical protein [Streptomyces sp. Ru72]|uniref:hypothetical protein n=1 Tax=Streptomyces sp. Ru72 TaxID=2080747 RepID=UPI000CDDBECC|nr:hypothetical protein [Streptomyces sp. Ru72]POX50095.1 hypothetical protein C3488_15715 [Streptomyces sp. Ru72]